VTCLPAFATPCSCGDTDQQIGLCLADAYDLAVLRATMMRMATNCFFSLLHLSVTAIQLTRLSRGRWA
jgi:hypothetical protein